MHYSIKFIILLLSYAINSTQFTSIPILFYRPQQLCLNNDKQSYSCSIQDACSNPNKYTLHSEYPHLQNLTMLLDLFCDREVLEAWILTISNFGRISANIILILYPIKSENKERWIGITTLLCGIGLCSLSIIQTLESFIIVYIIWYHMSSYLYGLVFSHLVESFPESIQKYGAAYLSNSTSFMMLIYIGFSSQFGTWQNTLIHFTGIPLLLLGGLSVLFSIMSSGNNNIIISQSLSPSSISKNNNNNNGQIGVQDYQYFEDTENIQISQQQQQQPKNILVDSLQNKNDSQISFTQQNIENNNNKNNLKSSLKNQNNKITAQIPIDSFQLTLNDSGEEDKNRQKKQLNFSDRLIKRYFPFLKKGENIKINFYLWTIVFSSYVMNYYGVCLIMNTLKGDLFINCLIGCVFEFFSSIISTSIIMKYNNSLHKVIIVTQTITAIAFLSTLIFGDPTNSITLIQSNDNNNNNSQSSEIFYLFLSLTPILIAKITFEITPSIMMAYQKDIIPLKYQQSQLSCSNLLTMIISNIMPFYKYFSSSLGINPFVGLGVITSLTAYYSKYFVQISDNKEKKQKFKSEK